MDNATLAIVLWIAAAIVLVLYLMRRGRRKQAEPVGELDQLVALHVLQAAALVEWLDLGG